MDKFTYALVGGVLGLVTAGLVAAAILRGQQSPPDLNTPAGVVMAYAQAEQRGDATTAWDLLATSAQARGDRDRFLARAGREFADRAYLTTEDQRLEGDSASVVLVRTYPASGGLFNTNTYANRTNVRLARESGAWRITVPPDDYLLSLSKS